MKFNDRINGVELSEIGTVILTGTEEFLAFPERKETYENDWREDNGSEYELSLPRFKDKEVTLKMGILARNEDAFWGHYDKLWGLLQKEGVTTIYIDDHQREYRCFYKKSGNFKKTLKRLRNVEQVFVKFELTFKVLT